MRNYFIGKKKTLLKVLVVTAILILGSIALWGCGSQPAPKEESKEVTPETPAKETFQLPKNVSIGTHQTGSVVYATGIAFADTLTKNTPIKGIVEAGPGPGQWLPLMRKGEIEFGIANQLDAVAAYNGELIYDEKTDLGVVKIGVELIKFGILVKDPSIKEIADLKGKRVSFGFPGHPINDILTLVTLANAGLTVDDIIPVPAPGTVDGVRNVMEGRADAAGISLGSAIVEEFAASFKGARFLSINPNPGAENLEKMDEIFPGVKIKEVPGGSVAGVSVPTNIITWDNYLMASNDVANEVVFAVAEALYNHYDDFKDVHPTLRSWGPELSVGKTTIPFHPGAIEFYKSVGIWTNELDEYQKTLSR